ncbi:hypothetical protein MKS88_005024 [Plasmodium brasilianum]|uniref:Uncharacterized protein n=1 Tax=Plasmodium brasilianum TaxID=5824 RepID=A0ACB9Y2Y7_PLABR|nr:hypothetical protein MKS88_005024 [Plasmodium brasilianum]
MDCLTESTISLNFDERAIFLIMLIMAQSDELNQDLPKKNSQNGVNLSQEIYDETNIDELKKKVNDLELQLEYEINRHDAEIKERDETIKMLEEKINELENCKRETEEKDDAILNMSEQLLILSNKYDILVKETKLQEEELKHLKNKKRYRNDETNEYIGTLKKQNNDFKKDNELINDKNAQLLKENSTLKNSCKILQEQLDENRKNLELVKKQITKDFDQKNALKILNIGTELIYKRNENTDNSNSLKLELEYKDMIIKRLLRKRVIDEEVMKLESNSKNNGSDNSNGNSSGNNIDNNDNNNNSNNGRSNSNDQLVNYKQKVDELYQKYLNSQSDNDKLNNKISKLNDNINDLKKENVDLLSIIDTLREYINKVYKEDVNIHQFDDLINNLLKENSTLNEELTKQKRKNMVDTYYFNKELQFMQNDKLKIIEKFDNTNINKIPHLYKPLNVTLNEESNNRDMEHALFDGGYNSNS